MKRIHWWTLTGLSGAGIAALLLGQGVFGQPEPRVSLPDAPFEAPRINTPAKTGSTAPLTDTKSKSSPAPLPSPAPKSGLPTPEFSVEPGPIPPPVSGRDVPKTTANNVSLDVQPGRQQPAVTIEWVGPTTTRVNQPMACQIVVRNTSTSIVQNVIVRHRLAPGVTCKSCEPSAVPDVGELVWNLGTLAPQQMRRIDLSLVSQSRGVLNCPATVTFSTVAAHQVQVREPQLAVKLSGPDKVVVGENVTLLFAISNPGDGVAESVRVKTVLPDGLEHPRGKVIDFEVGNLAPKEIKTMQLVCAAKGSGVQQCLITASGEGSLTSNDAAKVEILMPKLDVVMSGPKLRYLDRHAVYTLKVTNPGSAPASQVEVQKFIPSGFKFHQANQGGAFQDATRLVSWNLGDLQPGQSKDVSVDLIPIEAGEHRLVAVAKAARGLKSEADARTLVEGLPSLALEVGHVDDPIEVGAETSYEIRVANTGTKTETNVEVVCILPDQLEFRGAKCSTTLRYRQEGRELVFEPLARLAPKADVIFRIQVKGIAPGDIRFRTRIRADGLKDPVLREESTRIYSDDLPVRPATNVPTPKAPTGPSTIPNATVPDVKPAPSPKSPAVPPTFPSPPAPEVKPAPLPVAPVTPPALPNPSLPDVKPAPMVPPLPVSPSAPSLPGAGVPAPPPLPVAPPSVNPSLPAPLPPPLPLPTLPMAPNPQ